MRYEYSSVFAREIQDFLLFREARNMRVKTERCVFNLFDRFVNSTRHTCASLTQEIVDGFADSRKQDSATYRYIQYVTLKNFALHLRGRGYEAYIPPPMRLIRDKHPHPYIYSDFELRQLFTAIDACKDNGLCHKHLTDPVMFRLIYACGLRASEATGLKIQDVDFERDCLVIRHSKNDKSRVVPFATSLRTRIQKLVESHRFKRNTDGWLFPSRLGTRLSPTQIDLRFKDYLSDAGIRLNRIGPRVHDLRHTFAVNCLRKWVLQGLDLMNALPYLSAYMGHSSCVGTEYYLRLTATMYPQIADWTENVCADVIPTTGEV